MNTEINKINPVLQKNASDAQEFLESLPVEVIEAINKKTRESGDEEFQQFKNFLDNGYCYLCGGKMDSFDEANVCMHWLLKPAGFNKKHFHLVYEKFNFLRIQSYLRWIATTEILAGNINDLIEELSPNKLLEVTIKYKNLEWTFSCANSDLAGHEGSFAGQLPHYHFQMRINNQSFIDYADFHIPFTEEDLFHLPIILGMVEKAKYAHTHSPGMQEMMDIDPEILLSSMCKTDDETHGVYNLQTLIEAEPGKTLSGDEIADLFKKSKELNVPVARLIGELSNLGSATTYIVPGPRVPEKAGRKRGGKKNKKN